MPIHPMLPLQDWKRHKAECAAAAAAAGTSASSSAAAAGSSSSSSSPSVVIKLVEQTGESAFGMVVSGSPSAGPVCANVQLVVCG